MTFTSGSLRSSLVFVGSSARSTPGSTEEGRQRLVAENVSFVRSSAAKLKETLPGAVEFDDLVQYGMAGLLEAAERYSRKHGVAFTTFAWYRVRGAMYDGLRQMGWLPRDSALRFEERVTAYLGNLTERDAGAGASGVAEPDDLDADVPSLADALAGVATVFVASSGAIDPTNPELELERREVRTAITRALARVGDKERRLLELYYVEDKSLEEAGQAIGLSKSWASRLHARAIGQLQAAMAGSPHAPTATGPPRKPRARR